MEALSRLDFYQIGRQYIRANATQIDPNKIDVQGSDINLFVGSASYMAYAISRQMVDRIGSLTLNGAVNEDLDRYAMDHYQLLRKGAAAAIVPLQFYRSSFTYGAGVIPINTSVQSITGIEYITTTTATFSSSGLIATCNGIATLAGNEYQVGTNQIQVIMNPNSLFDPTIQVVNPSPAAGGASAESDENFKNRIINFWQSAQRGTLGAIQFGALTVPGIDSAYVEEVINTAGNPVRLVNLYVADASGVSNIPLVAKVKAILNDYRAGGIYVNIIPGSPQIISVTLSLTFSGNVDTSTITEAIKNAIVAFVNSLGVNQTLSLAALYSLLYRYADQGLVVNEQTIVTPTGSIIPTSGCTLRTTLANVTVTA